MANQLQALALLTEATQRAHASQVAAKAAAAKLGTGAPEATTGAAGPVPTQPKEATGG